MISAFGVEHGREVGKRLGPGYIPPPGRLVPFIAAGEPRLGSLSATGTGLSGGHRPRRLKLGSPEGARRFRQSLAETVRAPKGKS